LAAIFSMRHLSEAQTAKGERETGMARPGRWARSSLLPLPLVRRFGSVAPTDILVSTGRIRRGLTYHPSGPFSLSCFLDITHVIRTFCALRIVLDAPGATEPRLAAPLVPLILDHRVTEAPDLREGK